MSASKTLHDLYDFGDGWEHTIKIERFAEAVPGLPYPLLLEAVGRCPPEDVGGPGATTIYSKRSPIRAMSVMMS